jgi:hypothetical protein
MGHDAAAESAHPSASSITLWVLIMFCGRLIAYNWFPPIQ